MHLWGAAGGNDACSGAAGGYSTAKVQMTANQKIYVYIGDSGQASVPSYGRAGWNGGGVGSTGYGVSGSGGGASDIRTISGEWYQNLWSRILVAGGGGGGGCYSSGGVGGGLIGGHGYFGGGTQTHAGPGGSFGIGATAPGDGGGGGGGWYGGGTITRWGDCRRGVDEGGGGGSSYIGGTATNPVTAASTLAGNAWMPNTSLTGSMLGNNGPCYGYFYLRERIK